MSKVDIDWTKVDDLGLGSFKGNNPWLFAERASGGNLVIDVGAHVGLFSFHALECGAQRVIAVEPDPNNYSVLCENIKAQNLGDRSIVPLNFALAPTSWERLKIFELGRGNSGQRSAFYKETKARRMTGEVWTINLATLINFACARHQEVDYLKIDVEGMEWIIFNWKACPILATALSRVKMIELELHANENDAYFDDPRIGEQSFNDLHASMNSYGFSLETKGGVYAPKLYVRGPVEAECV